MGSSLWNRLSVADRWTLNREFLDAAIRRGDQIILATPPNQVRSGSYLAREVEYLESNGYRFDQATSSMVRPE